MKKAIITVVGKDRVGIIAKICTYLSDNNINILDISQTIKDDFFNMMMIADFTDHKASFKQHAEALERLGQEIGVRINLQLEDIFNAMHRI